MTGRTDESYWIGTLRLRLADMRNAVDKDLAGLPAVRRIIDRHLGAIEAFAATAATLSTEASQRALAAATALMAGGRSEGELVCDAMNEERWQDAAFIAITKVSKLYEEQALHATARAQSVDEDYTVLLGADGTAPAPRRIAAFLRLYAGRIRAGERWDIPETVARALESAAISLDASADGQAATGRVLRGVALEALIAWDSDRDSRVGKILGALAGRMPGYRADVDALLAALDAAGGAK